MAPSLALYTARFTAAQAMPHELDLAARLWEATENLEQREKRAIVHGPDIPYGLANHLERVD